MTLFFSMMWSFAHASVPEGTPVSPQTMAVLGHWVEEATHVNMDVLPVAIASDARLRTALRIDDVQRAGAAAAYLPGRIVISPAIWDETSIRAQSYIVHELVHHAQFISGRAYACHAAKEHEAYTLQNQWLAEKGQAPIVNQDWIDRMSTCADGNRESD